MPIITTTKATPERAAFDFYPTPIELCRAAVRLLPRNYLVPPAILDAGAGAGPWGQAARERYPDAGITGIDIRDLYPHEAYNEWFCGDFLTNTDVEGIMPYTFVIGNPPYKYAEEFVRRGLGLLKGGGEGQLVYLLRIEFLASQKRGRGLFRDFPPYAVYPCVSRPSFTGDGRTNATDYAIYKWIAGWQGETQLRWLDWKGRDTE